MGEGYYSPGGVGDDPTPLQGTMTLLHSPMEQYETYPILGALDSYGLALLVGVGVLLTLDSFAGDTVIPDRYSMGGESLYSSVLEMVHSYAGPRGGVYFPLLLTLFLTILTSNLVGMLPYSFAAFSGLVANLSLGVTLLGGLLTLGGLRHRGLLLGFFAPAGTPLPLVPLMVVLEIVSFLTRTFALGLRLGVNMITGHTLVKVVGGFIWLGYLGGLPLLVLALPIGLLAVLMCLEIVIAYLQAYIFVFITCLTLKELGHSPQPP